MSSPAGPGTTPDPASQTTSLFWRLISMGMGPRLPDEPSSTQRATPSPRYEFLACPRCRWIFSHSLPSFPATPASLSRRFLPHDAGRPDNAPPIPFPNLQIAHAAPALAASY